MAENDDETYDESMSDLLDSAVNEYQKSNMSKQTDNGTKENDTKSGDVFENFETNLNECLKNLSDSLNNLAEPELFNDASNNDVNIDLSDMSSMISSMMTQFLSKELVYPPIASVVSNYPEWLKKNESKLSKELFNQRTKQYNELKEVCDIYEASQELTDQEREKIMKLIEQAMQHGPPPEELVVTEDGVASKEEIENLEMGYNEMFDAINKSPNMDQCKQM